MVNPNNQRQTLSPTTARTEWCSGFTYQQKVDFFFGDQPYSPNKTTGETYRSTLHLIKKDLAELSTGGCNSLTFPRAMCLMVAVDLCAKLYRGNDQEQQAGARFRDFVNDFDIDPARKNDAGPMIWALRNALHHSYRMPTEWRATDGRQPRRFRLIDNRDKYWVSSDQDEETFINLYVLQKKCLDAFAVFHDNSSPRRLENEKQEGLIKMFHKYGWLVVTDHVSLP